MQKIEVENLNTELFALELAEDYILSEASLSHFIRAAWDILEPRKAYLHNWHIDAISEHLEAIHAGDIRRLIINMPPRYMKSIAVTVCFPVWLWLRSPEARILAASYSSSLSIKHNVDRRRLIQSPWFQTAWSGRFQIDSDNNQKSEFTNNHRGHMIATSVGGGVTGKGGSCFPAGTKVLTDKGAIAIETLVQSPEPIRVLSFNHEYGRMEFKPVLASRVLYADELIEIKTSSGRTIRCTSDHRIYCLQRGYWPAEGLAPGDKLITSDHMPCVQEKKRTSHRLFVRVAASACCPQRFSSLALFAKSLFKDQNTRRTRGQRGVTRMFIAPPPVPRDTTLSKTVGSVSSAILRQRENPASIVRNAQATGGIRSEH